MLSFYNYNAEQNMSSNSNANKHWNGNAILYCVLMFTVFPYCWRKTGSINIISRKIVNCLGYKQFAFVFATRNDAIIVFLFRQTFQMQWTFPVCVQELQLFCLKWWKCHFSNKTIVSHHSKVIHIYHNIYESISLVANRTISDICCSV